MPGQMRQSFWQGRGPQVLQGSANAALSGRANAYPVECFMSPILNLTQTYTGIELVPARPGYIPAPRARPMIIVFQAGTQVTPPGFQAGSDPAHSNTILPNNVSPSNANFNSGTPTPWIVSANFSNNDVQLFPNTPVYLDVTSPGVGTGGYALLALIGITVEWIAGEIGQ